MHANTHVSAFFSKFSSYFKGKNNSENTLSLSLQDVSNDKYLKLYKIKSNLVDYNNEILENEFTEDEKKNWNLEIIHEEQLIRFNAPDVMFNLNADELTSRYKKIINYMHDFGQF